MLRMTTLASAQRAKDYFREALSRGEYYLDEKTLNQEVIGRWGGRAAARLSLEGQVTREAFELLCDNLHPQTGRKLTPRTKAGRRVGHDIEFSVPKSVSLMLELAGDRRIERAFRESVHETMAELERDAQTRVRRDGADETRDTGNLVWAEFVHFTARPVDGVPDPHLHAHMVTFNVTWDETEARWKAADLGAIKSDAPYFQAAQQARLKHKLVGLGYEIDRRGSGWEIKGVPMELVRGFSRRTEEIERLIQERGITDAVRKANLGAQTREHKIAVASMDELRGTWNQRLSPDHVQRLEDLSKALEDSASVNRTAQEIGGAFEQASEHLMERQSTMRDRELLGEVLNRSTGGILPEMSKALLETMVGDGSLIRGEWKGIKLLTLPRVLKEEQMMLRTVREGRGAFQAIAADHAVKDPDLSDEQRAAVRHVLGSTDGLIAITGRAGVGKTRVMQEVVRGIEANGLVVQPAAPTAMAADSVLKKDGFHNAVTVAELLQNTRMHDRLRGQVIWIDEAGLLGTPDMAKAVKLAKSLNARLLVTGDTRQHNSVSRGDALRLIQSHGGVKAVELSTVRRQLDVQYRKACQQLAQGELDRGFGTLDKMGAIREIDDDRRADELAVSYVRSVSQKRSALVISPTHAEGARVTERIRHELKAAGHLGERERQVERLKSRQLSHEQRQDATSYRIGDVIEFHQNAPGGFRRSDRAEVIAVEDGIRLKRERDKAVKPLDASLAARFEVYEKRSLAVAKGEQVRITANGRTADGKHRLNRGSIYEVTGRTQQGELKLANGWTVGKDFGHLAHGYCVTSYSSQGRTVDHLLIAQGADSGRAANRKQFYTSVTRGRRSVTIFTDDKQRLMQSVARDASRVSASEITQRHLPHRDLERALKESELAKDRRHARRSMGLWASREKAEQIKQAVNRQWERVKEMRRRLSRAREEPGHER